MVRLIAAIIYHDDLQNSARPSFPASIWVAAMTAFSCCPSFADATADFKPR